MATPGRIVRPLSVPPCVSIPAGTRMGQGKTTFLVDCPRGSHASPTPPNDQVAAGRRGGGDKMTNLASPRLGMRESP